MDIDPGRNHTNESHYLCAKESSGGFQPPFVIVLQKETEETEKMLQYDVLDPLSFKPTVQTVARSPRYLKAILLQIFVAVVHPRNSRRYPESPD